MVNGLQLYINVYLIDKMGDRYLTLWDLHDWIMFRPGNHPHRGAKRFKITSNNVNWRQNSKNPNLTWFKLYNVILMCI